MKHALMTAAVVLLAGCTAHQPRAVSVGNDALPSAEVIAFQATDARLHYRDARIGYDARSCAVYEGVAPGGEMAREPLADANGQPICVRR